MASRAREHWVKLEVAPFCIEVFKHSENLAEWVKSLAECLAYGDPSLNEFGAKLLSEADGYRESKVEAAKKRWSPSKNDKSPSDANCMQSDAHAMQNDAHGMQSDAHASFCNAHAMRNDANGMQNDAITSFDVMLCNSSSSDLGLKEKEEKKGITREDVKNDHAENPYRAVACTNRPDGGAVNSPDLSESNKPKVGGLGSPIASGPTLGIPEVKKASSIRTSGQKKLIPLGKTALEMEYPAAHAVWSAYPSVGRGRSSTMEFLKAWRDQLKNGGIPELQDVLDSLERWKRSKKWADNNGAYIEGAHRWVANRQWENVTKSTMEIAHEQFASIDSMFAGVAWPT